MATHKLTDLRRRLPRLVDFLFEAGMLRHTPRSGWSLLGTGKENVADHCFRVAVLCFTLARMAGADPLKAAVLGLFHDLHEARTSDLNYMNQRYATLQQRKAQEDAVDGTGLEEDIMGLYDEFENRNTPEARLAKDADQLDLLFNLKEELDKGNAFAREWIDSAVLRLKTPEAQELAQSMLTADHNRWWYGRVDRRWWVDRRRRLERSQTEQEEPVRHSFGHWSPETRTRKHRTAPHVRPHARMRFPNRHKP